MCVAAAITIRLVKRSEDVHQNGRGAVRLSLRGRGRPSNFISAFLFLSMFLISLLFQDDKAKRKPGATGWLGTEVLETRVQGMGEG